ncbi:hypothetical protein QR680_004260 [Steinernema hermaphroditum]|uniref:Uncharacterized protein n=1 Tax=Steinernema hermaphroditum TaxID=289476 RepID=A0AA39HP81_9BILA|nr:hypothetical protein QR680_004260 [Steinernema hermaphroditum]
MITKSLKESHESLFLFWLTTDEKVTVSRNSRFKFLFKTKQVDFLSYISQFVSSIGLRCGGFSIFDELAAQKLKSQLDETDGRSHWPEQEVHRFGVLIFNDTLLYPPLKEDDPNAIVLLWNEKGSMTFVYKSTFGSNGNVTYLDNLKCFEENIAIINNALGNVLRGGCYFGPHFDAIVPRDLRMITKSLKESHESLFLFWLTTDEKVTVSIPSRVWNSISVTMLRIIGATLLYASCLWITSTHGSTATPALIVDFDSTLGIVNETDETNPVATALTIQRAISFLKGAISGYSSAYPPVPNFLDFARTLAAIPTLEKTPQINIEVAKLRDAMAELEKKMIASATYLGSLILHDRIHNVIEREDFLSASIANRKNINAVCTHNDPLWIAHSLHSAVFREGYIRNLIERSHYSLAHYTELRGLVYRMGFRLMSQAICYEDSSVNVLKPAEHFIGRIKERVEDIDKMFEDELSEQKRHWWPNGTILEVARVLSSFEFQGLSKESAAQTLKDHLDETFGYSRFPREEVHRFGVVIFNDTIAYTSVKEQDRNALILPWPGQGALILIYKSTFGGNGNDTYLSNRLCLEQNSTTIASALEKTRITGRSCFFPPDFNGIVGSTMVRSIAAAKKRRSELFFFGLTSDQLSPKETVDTGPVWWKWVKSKLPEFGLTNRQWTGADVGWAFDKRGASDMSVGTVMDMFRDFAMTTLCITSITSLFLIIATDVSTAKEKAMSTTFNTTDLHRLQSAVALLKTSISGYAATYPPPKEFLDFGATIAAIPTFEKRPEIKQEIDTLRDTMTVLRDFVAEHSFLTTEYSFAVGRKFHTVVIERYDLSYCIDDDLMADPYNINNEMAALSCSTHPPLALAESFANILVNTSHVIPNISYIDAFLYNTLYKLSDYTKLKALTHTIGFELLLYASMCNHFRGDNDTIGELTPAKITEIQAVFMDAQKLLDEASAEQKRGSWKNGIIFFVEQIPLFYDFRDMSKAARKLKGHLDESYGYSHWPKEDVHRFGVLIFRNSLLYTPLESKDPNAVLLTRTIGGYIILIYKSTFGNDGNATYLSNKKFVAQNSAFINGTFSSVLKGECYFSPLFESKATDELNLVAENINKRYGSLFFFWLTTDKTDTVPNNGWFKWLSETKEVDRKLTEADVGWAVGNSDEPRIAAVIKTEMPATTCLFEPRIHPLQVMVGL